MNKSDQKDALMARIGYQFRDMTLLNKALTHRSCGKENNERLEFLGDSIVNCVTAQMLFERFKDASEGQLSRLRAYLVRRETLAELARNFQVEKAIRLGQGEARSGGAKRPTILCDAMEALIGAIFLDSSMEHCTQCIRAWYEDWLETLTLNNVMKDPKSLLQEYLQGQKLPLPDYELVSAKGEEHDQTFIVACHVALLEHPVIGEGKSRRKAEQQAAQHTLQELTNHGK